MVGYGIFQTEVAEPAVSQVQMDPLAQSALGTDVVAVANDQNADSTPPFVPIKTPPAKKTRHSGGLAVSSTECCLQDVSEGGLRLPSIADVFSTVWHFLRRIFLYVRPFCHSLLPVFSGSIRLCFVSCTL